MAANAFFRVTIISWCLSATTIIAQPHSPEAQKSMIVGLDHIPLAVADLEAAAERFKQLGFALKPGRPHANGIRNQHVKFKDGTEIELITTPTAIDALTAEYRQHLDDGDGAVFLGLFVPNRRVVAGILEAHGWRINHQSGMLTFPENTPLRQLFFAGRNQSPSDRPVHFQHQNGAVSLFGVWLAGAEAENILEVIITLAGEVREKPAWVPDETNVRVVELLEGEIVFLPEDRQLMIGRPIIGATLLVRDLQQTRAYFRTHFSEKVYDIVENATSLFVPPAIAHGVWLEFREDMR